MLYCVIPAANIFIPFQLFLVCMLTPIRSFTQADPSGPDHPLPYNFLSNVFQLPIAVSTRSLPCGWLRIWYPPIGRWIPWLLRWHMRSRFKWKYFLLWVSYSLGDACFSSWKCTSESRRSSCLSQDPQGSTWSHRHQASTFLLPAYQTSQIFSASGPWLTSVSDVFAEKQNMCYVHV